MVLPLDLTGLEQDWDAWNPGLLQKRVLIKVHINILNKHFTADDFFNWKDSLFKYTTKKSHTALEQWSLKVINQETCKKHAIGLFDIDAG